MTLERALAPLMTIGAFCNLAMFEYPVGQSRTYITCLYALAKCSLLTYFVYYSNCIDSFYEEKTVYLDELLSLLTIILIPISICRFKELKICLLELAIVDHTLETLGTPKEYRRLRNFIIRMIIGLIVYVCYLVTFSAFRYSFRYDLSWFDILDIFLLLYPHNAVTLSALISAAILGLVL
ncbi:hypothetical protein ALC57_03775 [Trachymyrmex cornetzi]|uniref:Gustatory receptor n=1 Tax=Trachymyrmex cornetzi TaxID=471704 RepID=A0A151JLR3_9HYME|nr:hypothetical protein ALC57_03775 [Trachymyrmex cornetzi]